jgi:glutathione S-transferase
MDLYYAAVSTYSQKVLIALYEKSIPFERRLVNLMDPAARAAYEAIYPIGKVPLLKPSADYMVPESTIIIEYLEGHFPSGTKLIPEGVDAARQARFIDRTSDLYLNEASLTLLFAGMKAEAQRDEQAMAKARKHLEATYRYYDERLAKQTWMCGEAFTMADCSTIPPLFYAQMVHPFAAHKNLVAYHERAKQRASYKKVLDELLPAWDAVTKAMASARKAA